MVYLFFSTLSKEKTKKAIKETINAIGGKVNNISANSFEAKWRSPKYHTIFPTKFRFYVGDGSVRVESGSMKMEFILMGFPLRGFHNTWDHFISNLLKRYPDVDFGIKAGDIELVAAEIVGDATEEVLVSTTYHSPSLSGAIIGGELFGVAGAIIGSSYGTSHTTTTVSTKFADCVLVRGRYSNGLLAEGRLSRSSPVYNEILVNMKSLSSESNSYQSGSTYIPTKDISKFSLEEQHAVRTAKDYLSCEHLSYSRKGLLEQLEYEGYSAAASELAVDSLVVDWKEQAAKSAKHYMSCEYLTFSPKGLIEQLEYNGYTPEEAQYGAKSVGY